MHDARPHNDSIFNILEFVNEYIMVALAYVMLNFTQLFQFISDVNEPGRQMQMDEQFNDTMANVAIGLISFMSFINLAVMIKLSFNKARNAWKKRKAAKKVLENMKNKLKAKVADRETEKSRLKSTKLETVYEQNDDDEKEKDSSQRIDDDRVVAEGQDQVVDYSSYDILSDLSEIGGDNSDTKQKRFSA